MSRQYSSHYPVDAMPGGVGNANAPEKPMVLVAFAKIVVLVGALLLFAPSWLEVLRDMAGGPPPVAWHSLRVAVLGGIALMVTVAVLVLKVWSGLLKHLART